MIIDVGEKIDSYIHYKTANAQQFINPEVYQYFIDQRNKALAEARSTATADQLNSMIIKMDGQVLDAKSSMDIIKALSQDNNNLLESTLDRIAQAMNEGIEKTFANLDYAQTITDIHNNFDSSLVGKNGMGKKAAETFFNEIAKALRLIVSEDSIPVEQFKTLQQIFSDGTGEVPHELTIITSGEIDIAQQIVKYLSSAAGALKKSNGQGISTESFRSTITNIFHTVIGEQLSKKLLLTGIQEAQYQTEQKLIDGLSKLPGKTTIENSGTKRTVNNRTATVDILTNNLFQLSTTFNNKQVDIELAVDITVKWGKKKGRKIQIVNNTKLGPFIEQMDNQQAIYNIIAHRYSSNYLMGSRSSSTPKARGGAFYSAYQTIKASVAGSFFLDWLTGSGDALGYGVDKAQFLMYNGKVYSVFSVIKAICDNIANTGQKTINVDIKGVDKIKNTWESQSTADKSPWEAARRRSDRVKETINSLTISGYFNANVMKNIKT